MKTVIISAFPGIGKIYAKKSTTLNVVDLNTNDFKFTNKIVNSCNIREVNSEYPGNYLNKIKELINLKDNAPDIIFISSHSDIRELLNKSEIPYFIIYPAINDKNKFITRYKERGNSDKFINNMEANWFKYIDGMINETYPIHIKADTITAELLETLGNYNNIIENTKVIAKKRIIDVIDPSKINWSILSRERRNWSEEDFVYRNYIDWDILCKFNKIPDSIIASPYYSSFINWGYLNKNKAKYGLKTRKLISKKV